MKILLFGKYGQLGWELHRTLQGLGEVAAYDYPEVDFAAPQSLPRIIKESRPDIVINAAAYTDVDKAESEQEKARLINAEAPGVLAEASRSVGAVFVHYSTDYVFDGNKGSPYVESDAPNPLNNYGRTKLEGEKAVLQAGGAGLILRTAWVYSLRGDSFVTKVLRWARTQNEIRVVDDQVSNPTWARHLAEVTTLVLASRVQEGSGPLSELAGIYHLAGWGMASRFEWARSVIGLSDGASCPRRPVIMRAKTGEFPTPATRPSRSALDCNKFLMVFGKRLPDWEESLREALDNG